MRALNLEHRGALSIEGKREADVRLQEHEQAVKAILVILEGE